MLMEDMVHWCLLYIPRPFQGKTEFVMRHADSGRAG